MIRSIAVLAFLAAGLGAAHAQETTVTPPAPADVVVNPAAPINATPKQANLLTGMYATKAVIELCAMTLEEGIVRRHGCRPEAARNIAADGRAALPRRPMPRSRQTWKRLHLTAPKAARTGSASRPSPISTRPAHLLPKPPALRLQKPRPPCGRHTGNPGAVISGRFRWMKVLSRPCAGIECYWQMRASQLLPWQPMSRCR